MRYCVSLLCLLVGAAAAAPEKRSVSTPLGVLNGTTTIPGVTRYVFKYASQPRWALPQQVATLVTLPTLPPVCPQRNFDVEGTWLGVEDCQYITVYVPNNLNGTTLAWFHHGSLIGRGADDPAIEGSKLALATSSIVAVIQYRLGVLGWLNPASSSSASNLGLRDAILGLNILKQVLPHVGGGSVTIGGYSSGAMLVRALMASPSANNLYTKAMMFSDVGAYAFYNASTLTTLQNNFFPEINCTSTDTACHSSASLDSIMQAQMTFDPKMYDPSTAGSIPFRPIKDGSLIQYSLTTSFPPNLKPLLVTSNHDEAGNFIFGALPALPAEAYLSVLNAVIPDFRANAIGNSTHYTLTSDPDTVRITLKNVVTDLGWRCADQWFARQWAQRGGKVYTGEVLRGAWYSFNADIDFCTESETQVCHHNDLPIIFGTTATPSATQASLTTEIQKRLKAFIKNANPNASGYATWNKTTSTATNLLPLGAGLSVTPPGACADLWGTPAAPFDWQMFNL